MPLSRHYYHEFAWAYDLLQPDPVISRVDFIFRHLRQAPSAISHSCAPPSFKVEVACLLQEKDHSRHPTGAWYASALSENPHQPDLLRFGNLSRLNRLRVASEPRLLSAAVRLLTFRGLPVCKSFTIAPYNKLMQAVGGSETVLVVDDEISVLSLATGCSGDMDTPAMAPLATTGPIS